MKTEITKFAVKYFMELQDLMVYGENIKEVMDSSRAKEFENMELMNQKYLIKFFGEPS